MNRRRFLKVLAGAVAVALCPIPLPATPASTIPEFKLTSAPVVPRVHKLRCTWSLESSKELRKIHGIEDQAMIERLQNDIAREMGIPPIHSHLIQI